MLNQILPISSIEHLNAAYFIITVDLGDSAAEIKAGQFFQIKSNEMRFPMLRKPISTYNVEGNYVSFMIKIMGKGTEILSKLRTGNRLDILGPLGNSFPLTHQKKVVLVSGGIGYPPLWLLKKELLKSQNQFYWLHGGRDMHDIFPADEIWTDDGSYGNKGFVTEGLAAFLQKDHPDAIYACGPKAMLYACHELAIRHNVILYVSLEEYMACGIGVCHGCAVAVKSDDQTGFTYKTVCKDGPVFDSREIVWQ
jgi:dihydroorotate dehydrogenase electron transfer subunit